MQRKFRIRDSVIRQGKQVFTDDFPPPGMPLIEPMPDVVWIRYHLTLKAMDKRFDDTATMLNYVTELENFIFSAITPLPDRNQPNEGSS